jgi:hypothetical protein
MKFDKKYKIQEAAAKEETRYAISEVLFEKDDNGARLVATNGRIMAVIPVEDADGDVPGFIERTTAIEATKGRTNSKPEAELNLPSSDKALVHTKAGTVEARRPDAEHLKFPDYRGVVPKDTDTGLRVNLSAEYLIALIKALGCQHNALDAITLTFQRDGDGIDQHAPVLAHPTGDDMASARAYGVIMPVSEA